MTPRTPLVVATCLLLALAAYLVHDTGGVEPASRGPEAVATRGDAGDAIADPGRASERAVLNATHAPGALPEPQFEVVLRIEPVGDLLPPTRRPSLRLWRGTTLVPAEVSWVAGSAALPGARILKGRQLVRFRLPGGQDIYRVVFLRRPDRDIEASWLGSGDYQGQVVGADQSPLAGASVWLAGKRAETDAEGRFHIPDLPLGSGLPLVIRAPGHAGTFRVLDLTRARGGRDPARNTFALAPGVDLQVRFMAPVEDLAKGAVFVQPEAGQGDEDTRLLHQPFFMQAIEGGVPLDKDGLATVKGLPEDCRVQISVWHPDTLVRQKPVVQLRHHEQGPARASIHGDKAALLVGKVRSGSQPVSGAWLVSHGAGEAAPWWPGVHLLPPFLYFGGTVPMGHAITAADGSYRLPLPIPARIRVTAPEHLGLALEVRAPGERHLVLPRPAAKDDPRLRLRFARPGGRTFRLHVKNGTGREQESLLLKDTDDYAQPLAARVLADIHVEVRERDGKVLHWDFPNLVVQGLVELPMDY